MEVRNIKITVIAARLRPIIALFILLGGCSGKEEADPLTVTDHIGKARTFYRQGNYEKAVEMYEKAAILEPANADAYLQLGIIYDDNIKEEDLAAHYYRRYLELDPDSDKADLVRKWMKESQKEEGSLELSAPKRPSGRSDRREELSPTPAPRPKPPPRTRVTPRVMEESAEPEKYTVRKGDTLAGISERFYGTRSGWELIYRANRETLPSPHALKVGQTLIIPSKRKKAVIEL